MSGEGVEFADLLRAYAAAQESAAVASAPEPAAEVLELAGRVRRRRLVRTGSVLAAGVAAALVGGIAVYGVTRPEPVPPAQSPDATQSAEPTTTPTASQQPTGEPTQSPPEAADVTRHVLLPDVEPATADLWAQTDGDWLLGGYTASKEAADGSSMTSPKVLYLVAPDGTAYEVPLPEALLPIDATMTDWELADWRPGDSRAVFHRPTEAVEGGDGYGEQVVVDLATGEELVTYPPYDSVMLLPGDRTLVIRQTDSNMTVAQVHDRDGYHLSEIGPFTAAPWRDAWVYGRGWALDPTRTQLVLETPEGMSAFDLAGLTQLTVPQFPAPAQAPCSPVGWLEHNRFVVQCAEMQDQGDGTQALGSYLWIGNLGDGSTRRLTAARNPDGSFVSQVWQVGDVVVAGRQGSATGCGGDVVVVARDGAQNLVGGSGGVRVTGVRDGLLIGDAYSCDTFESGGLVSVDVGTGQVSMVLPRVEGATVSFDQGLGVMVQNVGEWW